MALGGGEPRHSAARLLAVALALATTTAARRARADYDPIEDNDWALDTYHGVAIGSIRVVGMGGVSMALTEGSSGASRNPSAVGLLPMTRTSDWSWDFHFDVLTASGSRDFENDGLPMAQGGASLAALGLSFTFRHWGVGLTATVEQQPLDGPLGALDASAVRVDLPIALSRWHDQLAIGAALWSSGFSLDPPTSNDASYDVIRSGLTLGATARPTDADWRIGAAFELPLGGSRVEDGCQTGDCGGYLLPNRVATPWQLRLGGAYRFARTRWNRVVRSAFRDERAVVVAADLGIVGASAGAYTMGGLALQVQQRSGDHLGIEPHVGLEHEVLPGRLRYRTGAYWEPGRADAAGGRFHGTVGADLACWGFHLFGPRRLRLSFTGDLAAAYQNVGLSLGLWQ